MSQPIGVTSDGAAAQEARALVLTRGSVARLLLEEKLNDEVEADRVFIVDIEAGPDEPAIATEDAIVTTDPSLVLFVGTGVAAHRSAAGGVLIADRVTALGSRLGRINRDRPLSRRVDPGVLRFATELVAARASRRQSAEGEAVHVFSRVSFGSIASGSQSLELWRDGDRATFWQRFSGAAALDLSGWDFLFGYYDIVELPALAILGLTRENELHSLDACRRAVDVAAELVRATPQNVPSSAPVADAADDGEQEHLRTDATSILHESTQGIVQRPFVDSARAAQVRQPGTSPAGTAKDRIDSATFNAYVDEENVQPEDLTLMVRGDDRKLVYELHGKGYYRSVGEVKLGDVFRGDPQTYRQNIMDEIRRISIGSQETQLASLETLGKRLYRDLFPAELKRAYRDFSRNDEIQTLLVVSEEAWIPWELVKPFDPDDDEFDEDFLCIRFAMTRWLRESDELKPRFKIHSVASLEAGSVPGADPLPTAKAECDYVRQLAQSRSVTTVESVGVGGGCAHPRTLLDAGTDIHLWHVAAHGRLDQVDPENSSIEFADGSWRPGDLIDKKSIRRTRPLVFLNACSVGQQDFILGQLAGWPRVWVRDHHCGAFIAPQWSVDSELATSFSRGFYDAVVGTEDGEPGLTLAEAVRAARTTVRSEHPADPTWLSYVVYGHPNARVRFEPAPAVTDA